MLAPLGPLLPLLVVMTHILAPPGPLLPLLVTQCQLIAPNFSLPGPLLQLLFVLTHVLAPQVRSVSADCSNSSLQDLHAFVLNKQPSFDSLLVYNQSEDSFNWLLCYAP